MQALTAFAPLAAFFLAYSLRGLYAATGVLMLAMALLLGFDWLRLRRVPPMHALSAVLVLLFGGATLLLHNPRFIQWKPTILFWLLSAAFLASAWLGRRALTELLLAPAVEARFTVSRALWRRLDLASAGFYALLGALNLVVAYYASERAWVYFKIFGLTVLVFAFLALQTLYLASRAGGARGELNAAQAPR
ncbi:MAG: septation protein IspZ [Gammaproteobacteria bacterium]|nr:septation protein IspZ [Gammaproteobacteria bacterium]